MTLQDIINGVGANPLPAILFFSALPLLALVLGWITKDEGLKNPWQYVYSVLIYLAAVPGIFGFTFTINQLFVEKKSITGLDFFFTLIPVLSMAATLFIVKSQKDLGEIPGFNKLWVLLFALLAANVLLYFGQNMRFFSITMMPLTSLIALMAGIFLVLYLVLKWLIK